MFCRPAGDSRSEAHANIILFRRLGMRDTWKSRSTFILAAIGSAVGLGNAWRFPGLAAAHGGGAFLFVYLVAMLVIGIPMLMMEIAIGRYVRKGAAGSMRAINKKAEFVGWMNVSNGIFIVVYYAVVFGWVILMFFESYKFAKFTGDTEKASKIWMNAIKTTGTTSGYSTIAWFALICTAIAWVSCWLCIRNGTTSVGKVVKFTVFLPVACLVIMAIRGFMMDGAMEGLAKFFVPDFSALKDSSLWVDAIGQVFYSLSVAMAIMFAYGSFLRDDANIAVDAIIIAFSDLLISMLAGVVMFTTMSGVGMLDKMTASGISTAFIVYPQAIAIMTDIPWVNAAFGYVFYFCLITLAIDSCFSIIEGVTTAISDKFGTNKRKTTIIYILIAAACGFIFLTGAGLAWLDIVDNYVNSYSLVLTGVIEAIVIGWFFKTSKVLDQINRNTKKFKMPKWWFEISIKFFAPIVLGGLFIWNMYNLIVKNGGIYGKADGYSVTANVIGGWSVFALVIFSGLIVKIVCAIRRKNGKGAAEEELNWDDLAATGTDSE